jgi:hypothetical protein
VSKAQRFDKPLDSHLTWRAFGANAIVSNREHRIIFILGTAHRDDALRKLRAAKRDAKKPAVKLTRKEKTAWEADL